MFTKMRIKENHSFYTDDIGDDEDEEGNAISDQPMTMECHNGNNRILKINNQKCVKCFENRSVYAVRPCVLQCICGNCYEVWI